MSVLGLQPIEYISFGSGPPQLISASVPEESVLCLTVNGQELATFTCSPTEPERLALGFLFNEHIIDSLADIRQLHLSQDKKCVDIWLTHPQQLPTRKIITSGCGGGITFQELTAQHTPLPSSINSTPTSLAELMKQTHLGATLYQESRGIHTASLAQDNQIIYQTEDIGRHNCLDKIAGFILQEKIDSSKLILITSGRISSEMVHKARRLQVEIICSRTSPTSASISLAHAWNITIVAYLRQDRMRLYTHPERILPQLIDPLPVPNSIRRNPA